MQSVKGACLQPLDNGAAATVTVTWGEELCTGQITQAQTAGDYSGHQKQTALSKIIRPAPNGKKSGATQATWDSAEGGKPADALNCPEPVMQLAELCELPSAQSPATQLNPGQPAAVQESSGGQQDCQQSATPPQLQHSYTLALQDPSAINNGKRPSSGAAVAENTGNMQLCLDAVVPEAEDSARGAGLCLEHSTTTEQNESKWEASDSVCGYNDAEVHGCEDLEEMFVSDDEENRAGQRLCESTLQTVEQEASKMQRCRLYRWDFYDILTCYHV
jgi:hypothetical protein